MPVLLDWLDARSRRVFEQTVNQAMVTALAMNDPEGLRKILDRHDSPDLSDAPKWWESQAEESAD